jgi:hypothetical protein
MKHKKESMSIYRKFKFKDSLARNMLSGSNMDHSLADETSEGVYMYRQFKIKDSLARNMLNVDHSLADETSEGVFEYL